MKAFASSRRAGMRTGVAFTVMAFLCGCSPSTPTRSAHLEGTVTLDGIPIEKGTLQFFPEDTTSGPMTQTEIVDGRYAATVALGKVRVVVHATKETGKTIQVFEKRLPEEVVIIPPRYRQGIPIEVIGDDRELDVSLTTH